MMLALAPAASEPTVSTANSPGSTSRETTVCRRKTIDDANTTGSTAVCGIDPCAPRPWIVILSESPAESTGPATVPIVPAAVGMTCWLSARSGCGTRSSRPSSTIARAPAAVSSPGWNTAM